MSKERTTGTTFWDLVRENPILASIAFIVLIVILCVVIKSGASVKIKDFLEITPPTSSETQKKFIRKLEDNNNELYSSYIKELDSIITVQKEAKPTKTNLIRQLILIRDHFKSLENSSENRIKEEIAKIKPNIDSLIVIHNY